MTTSAGKIVALQGLGQGKMFEEMSAIDGKARSARVWTADETNIIRISGPNFKAAVARIPILAELAMLRLCDLSRFLYNKAVTRRDYTIPEQIRLEICSVISAPPPIDGALAVDPASTHEEIAQLVGTNREQVTRVMRDFLERGLILYSRQPWHVPDMDAACEALLEGI
jgi:CRP/FNR family cyclic AMP-dependent transcriptional regulator